MRSKWPAVPIILSAGASRSGSTWLFNAVRLLLKLRYKIVYSCWVDEYELKSAHSANVILIKLHERNEELARRAQTILTSHRDLRDVAVSMRDMGWIKSNEQWLSWISSARTNHEYWMSQSQLDLPYEQIQHHPFNSVCILSKTLFPLESAFRRIVFSFLTYLELKTLPAAKSSAVNHHPVTLLHYRHRASHGKSRWKTSLPSDISDEILTKHKSWLEKMGYLNTADEGKKIASQ